MTMPTSRTRAMTLLILAFVVGAIVGGGALGMALRAGKADWVFRLGRSTGRPGTGQREDFATRLSRQLKLTAPQKDSVMVIYRHALADMDSINKASFETSHPLWLKIDSLVQPFRASVDSSRNRMRADIRAILVGPQQQAFDSLVIATDEARRRRRDFQGAGGPGPRGDGSGRGGSGDGPSGRGRTGPGGPGQPGGGVDRGPF